MTIIEFNTNNYKGGNVNSKRNNNRALSFAEKETLLANKIADVILKKMTNSHGFTKDQIRSAILGQNKTSKTREGALRPSYSIFGDFDRDGNLELDTDSLKFILDDLKKQINSLSSSSKPLKKVTFNINLANLIEILTDDDDLNGVVVHANNSNKRITHSKKGNADFENLPGDLDNNGDINLKDAILGLKVLSEVTTPKKLSIEESIVVDYSSIKSSDWHADTCPFLVESTDNSVRIYDVNENVDYNDADEYYFRIDKSIVSATSNTLEFSLSVGENFDPLWGEKAIEIRINNKLLEPVDFSLTPVEDTSIDPAQRQFIPISTEDIGKELSYIFKIPEDITNISSISLVTAGAANFDLTISDINFNCKSVKEISNPDYVPPLSVNKAADLNADNKIGIEEVIYLLDVISENKLPVVDKLNINNINSDDLKGDYWHPFDCPFKTEVTNNSIRIYDPKDNVSYNDAANYTLDINKSVAYGQKQLIFDFETEGDFSPLWGGKIVEVSLDGELLDPVNLSLEYGPDGRGFISGYGGTKGTYIFNIPKEKKHLGLISLVTAGARNYDIKISNIHVMVKPESEPIIPRQVLQFNKRGYVKGVASNYVALELPGNSNIEMVDFIIINDNEVEVHRGQSSFNKIDIDSDRKVMHLDLPKDLESGSYKIVVKAQQDEIATNLTCNIEVYENFDLAFNSVRNGALAAFWGFVSGTKGPFGDAHIQDKETEIYDSPGTYLDVTGGFNDAGDYGHYVATGANVILSLLQVKEYSNSGLTYDVGVNVPDDSDSRFDYMSFVLHEADFISRMQATNGGFYSKVASADWPMLNVAPENDLQPKKIMPVTTAATASAVAAMAKSFIYLREGLLKEDKKLAIDCMLAADRGWTFLVNNPDSIRIEKFYDGHEYGGHYDDENDSDNRLLAAVELFGAKNILLKESKESQNDWNADKTYKKGDYVFAESSTNTTMKSLWIVMSTTDQKGISPKDSDSEVWAEISLELTKLNDYTNNGISLLISSPDFNDRLGDVVPDWANVNNLALFSYLKAKGADSNLKSQIEEKVISYGDMLLEKIEKDGYSVAFAGSGDNYDWGSCGVIAETGKHLMLVYKLTDEQKYLDAATRIADHLLGLNPNGISYVIGQGDTSASDPHYRPHVSGNYPDLKNNMIVGGPNSVFYGGDTIGESLYHLPKGLIYKDHHDAWSLNEVAINWQAATVGFFSLLAEGILKPN